MAKKPQTNAERQRAFRASQKAAGLKELRNLWIKPKHEAALRLYAEKLNKK